jgi:hypothetical protein
MTSRKSGGRNSCERGCSDMSRLKARLERLEAVLTLATPHVLTITAVASATGEIISEHHLVMYPPNHRSRQTRYWGEPAQTERADRR